MTENNNTKKQQDDNGIKLNVNQQIDFLTNYKEKFNKSLKILGYYFIVLISMFFIVNFTDYFSYKIIFGSNQVALNEGLENKTIKNNDGRLNNFIEQKYINTLQKYKNFFGIDNTVISGYYCINVEGVIKKMSINNIKKDINNLKPKAKGYKRTINKTTADLLANLYANCGRNGNIYRIKYNDVYNGNVMIDVLSINMSGNNEDNIYKIYKYVLANSDGFLLNSLKNITSKVINKDMENPNNTLLGKLKKTISKVINKEMENPNNTLLGKLKKTIETYYEDIYEQIGSEKKTELSRKLYSADKIITSSNLKITLFKNEISDIKMWFDGNENLGFFSKLAWISDGLYDLAAFNIKGTFKYLFDSILYKLPIVSFMYLNISSFIITGMLTVFLFFLLDILPMSMLALGGYFKLENIIFYIINFFYTLVYYFIEIIIVIFIISKIIGFLVNVV